MEDNVVERTGSWWSLDLYTPVFLIILLHSTRHAFSHNHRYSLIRLRYYAAARHVGLNLIATIQKELGDLDRVEKIVKLLGVVHSTDDFYEQHVVMNGVSDLFMEVFGKERGVHARSAIGVNTLPLGISVEVEAIVQFK